MSKLSAETEICGICFVRYRKTQVLLFFLATVRRTCLSDVSVRGRPCAPPPQWNRNIFSRPLVDSDVQRNVTKTSIPAGHGIWPILYNRVRCFLPPPSVFPFSFFSFAASGLSSSELTLLVPTFQLFLYFMNFRACPSSTSRRTPNSRLEACGRKARAGMPTNLPTTV